VAYFLIFMISNNYMINVKMAEASNNSNCFFRVLKMPVLIEFMQDVCEFC